MEKHKFYFGTDGIRGKYGKQPITPEFAYKLGKALGKTILIPNENPVLIASDTRISSTPLTHSLVSGLSSAGINCNIAGIMPSPCVAHLTRSLDKQLGIVISASHNTNEYNGFKFFTRYGFKLSDALETEIERAINAIDDEIDDQIRFGQVNVEQNLSERYIEYCKTATLQDFNLTNIKVALDTANGAGYKIFPQILSELNISYVAIGNKPNGSNINLQCGATKLTALRDTVLKHNCDLGIAVDGDADRIIMIDHKGNIINGDKILYIMTKYFKDYNNYKQGVIGTTMSNYGLEHALDNLNIPFIRTEVGDRHILSALLTKGWLLGGETSGHIINLDKSTSGDGILTALSVLSVMNVHECSLHDLTKEFVTFPQAMVNVEAKEFERKKFINLLNTPEMKLSIKNTTEKLNSIGKGRVVIRPSGTENVLRIMVEGEDKKIVEQYANELADLTKKLLQEKYREA